MKKIALFSLAVILAGLGALTYYLISHPGGTPSSSGLEEVTISMGYIPNVQFAPFYIAQDNGYFRDRGIEVTFDYGTAPDITSKVASGEVEFAITDGEGVLLARSQGLPVRSVLSLYPRLPVSLVSLSSFNLRTPEDLRGKTIGIPGLYGSNYTALLAFLDATIGRDAVTIEPIGYTQVEMVSLGKVDAAVVFTNNEPVQLRADGYEVREIQMNSYISLTGAALLTNESMISDSPDIVRAVAQAVQEGMQFAAQDPTQAFTLSVSHIPDLVIPNYPIQQQILNRSLPLWLDSEIPSAYGHNITARWDSTLDILGRLQLLGSVLQTASEAYTNEFLQ